MKGTSSSTIASWSRWPRVTASPRNTAGGPVRSMPLAPSSCASRLTTTVPTCPSCDVLRLSNVASGSGWGPAVRVTAGTLCVISGPCSFVA